MAYRCLQGATAPLADYLAVYAVHLAGAYRQLWFPWLALLRISAAVQILLRLAVPGGPVLLCDVIRHAAALPPVHGPAPP